MPKDNLKIILRQVAVEKDNEDKNVIKVVNINYLLDFKKVFKHKQFI